jgi:hypothetical protein
VLVRLGGPWCDPTKVYFDEVNRIIREQGRWTPYNRSEDWFFTSRAARHGAKVMATTVVRIEHHGTAKYPNDIAGGNPIDYGSRGPLVSSVES